MPLDPKKALALAEEVVAAGKKISGAAVQATVSSSHDANTRFAVNQITTTGDVDETTITVEIAFGNRHANVTTNQSDPASIKEAVASAARLAKLAPEDPEFVPYLGAQKIQPVKGAYDDKTAKLGAAERAAVAGKAIDGATAAGLVTAGFYTTSAGSSAIATSAGLKASHQSTWLEYTTTTRTSDGTGSGWGQAAGNAVGGLGLDAASQAAIDKAKQSAGAKKLEPGKYTVILEPAAVGDLLGFLVAALDARGADEGRSFFAKAGGGTKVGDKLFADLVSLTSNPHDALTPAAPFDGDGLPLGPMTWIDKGTVKALRYSRYWAKKQGKPPTGEPSTYLLSGGTSSYADLFKDVKKGVLITHFFYTRWVDPQAILITGLTRDGIFLIEDGVVTAPVNNFRFNESPAVMLKNCDAMTKDTVRLVESGWRVPALRTHEFNLASVSDAV